MHRHRRNRCVWKSTADTSVLRTKIRTRCDCDTNIRLLFEIVAEFCDRSNLTRRHFPLHLSIALWFRWCVTFVTRRFTFLILSRSNVQFLQAMTWTNECTRRARSIWVILGLHGERHNKTVVRQENVCFFFYYNFWGFLVKYCNRNFLFFTVTISESYPHEPVTISLWRLRLLIVLYYIRLYARINELSCFFGSRILRLLFCVPCYIMYTRVRNIFPIRFTSSFIVYFIFFKYYNAYFLVVCNSDRTS